MLSVTFSDTATVSETRVIDLVQFTSTNDNSIIHDTSLPLLVCQLYYCYKIVSQNIL